MPMWLEPVLPISLHCDSQAIIVRASKKREMSIKITEDKTYNEKRGTYTLDIT